MTSNTQTICKHYPDGYNKHMDGQTIRPIALCTSHQG